MVLLDVGSGSGDLQGEVDTPPQRFGVIGVMLNLTPLQGANAVVSVTAKRLKTITATISFISGRGISSSGEAASLFGTLGFTISSTLGRVGHAKNRPAMRRAYNGILKVSRNLQCCFLWCLRYMRVY